MASYRVLQDIEADDKLIGNLSLKQFIFASIAVVMLFIGWWVGRGIGFAVMLLPAAPFLFLAAPLGRDQPNDIWLASRLRFWFKPRTRKWDQSGLEELVTITAPKLEDHVYTDGLSKGEVQSRLKALATTIDSRGWATKNTDVNYRPAYGNTPQNVDRLVQPSNVPQAVADGDLKPWDDVLDADNSAVGQHFQDLIDTQEQKRRQAAVDTINTSVSQAKTQTPESSAEKAFLDKIHNQQHKLGIDTPAEKAKKPLQKPVAPTPIKAEAKKAPEPTVNPAIIESFKDADDLKVSTIASMAKKASDDLLEDNEVINLH